MADRLACEPDITLIGIANPEDNLVAEIETVVPDVVLLDTSPRDALAMAARLIKERPQTRILGFGVCDMSRRTSLPALKQVSRAMFLAPPRSMI
jgi:chemotaxis response regulator CheB